MRLREVKLQFSQVYLNLGWPWRVFSPEVPPFCPALWTTYKDPGGPFPPNNYLQIILFVILILSQHLDVLRQRRYIIKWWAWAHLAWKVTIQLMFWPLPRNRSMYTSLLPHCPINRLFKVSWALQALHAPCLVWVHVETPHSQHCATFELIVLPVIQRIHTMGCHAPTGQEGQCSKEFIETSGHQPSPSWMLCFLHI